MKVRIVMGCIFAFWIKERFNLNQIYSRFVSIKDLNPHYKDLINLCAFWIM